MARYYQTTQRNFQDDFIFQPDMNLALMALQKKDNDIKEQLSTLIFDMEVINGLALCDWDLASRPTEWNDWNTDYKEDADDLKKQLVSILTGLQKEYLRILD